MRAAACTGCGGAGSRTRRVEHGRSVSGGDPLPRTPRGGAARGAAGLPRAQLFHAVPGDARPASRRRRGGRGGRGGVPRAARPAVRARPAGHDRASFRRDLSVHAGVARHRLSARRRRTRCSPPRARRWAPGRPPRRGAARRLHGDRRPPLRRCVRDRAGGDAHRRAERADELRGSGTNALDRGVEALAYAQAAMLEVPEEALWERRFGSATIRLRKRYRLVPRGVAVCFACATFPTWNAYPALLASLATGNPVIVKPHPTAILPMALDGAHLPARAGRSGVPADLVTICVDTPPTRSASGWSSIRTPRSSTSPAARASAPGSRPTRIRRCAIPRPRASTRWSSSRSRRSSRCCAASPRP
jgi:hypothetical protein